MHVFYSIGAMLVLISFVLSLYGVRNEFGHTNANGMPSLIFWLGMIACSSQLIAISIYGGRGVRDYSMYQPDYSIIVASVALGTHFFSCLFFLVEICTKNKKYKVWKLLSIMMWCLRLTWKVDLLWIQKKDYLVTIQWDLIKR